MFPYFTIILDIHRTFMGGLLNINFTSTTQSYPVIQNADSVAVAVSVAVSQERDDTVVAERIAVVAA